jgi:Tol biopolymer transport system component
MSPRIASSLLFIATQTATSTLLLAYSIPTAFAAVRLNTDQMRPVREFQVAPDGERVVIRSGNPDGNRIYSRLLHTDDVPVLLSDPAITDASGAFQISPDSQWVVMRMHDLSGYNSQDLFTRRIDGSGPLSNLGPDLTFVNYAEASGTFKIVPQTNDLVVRAYENQVDGFYSASIDGTSELKRIATSTAVSQFFFLVDDGKRIVFRSHQAYSVPVDGSTPRIELSGGLIPWDLAPTPDGRRIVFNHAPDLSSPLTWYSTPVDGSGPLAALGTSTSVHNLGRQLNITPDSSRFLFLSDQAIEHQFELYSRVIDASAPAEKLNASLTLGGDIANISISPDSQWSLFSETDHTGQIRNRFLTRADGSGEPVPLDLPTPEGYEVDRVFFTPDSRNLLYTASRTEEVSDAMVWTREYFQLLSRPVDESHPAVLLSTNVGRNQNVADIHVTPDGQYVLYGKDPKGADRGLNIYDYPSNHELYVVPVNGGTPQLVNDPLSAGEVLFGIEFTPDGQSILYETNLNGDLFFAAIPQPSSAIPIQGDYDANGAVDTRDYVLWRKTLGQSGLTLPADGNLNGVVDQADYDVWRAHFGRTAESASAARGASTRAVPEPSYVTLILLVSLLGLCPVRAVGLRR